MIRNNPNQLLPVIEALEEQNLMPTFTPQQHIRPDPRNTKPLVTKHLQGGIGISGGRSYQQHDRTSNLQSLFENLDGISAQELGRRRTGSGGSGGGAQAFEGNMDANALISLNPYLEENVTSFSHGGNIGGSVSMDIDNERPAGLHGGNSGRGPYAPHQPGSSAYKAYVDQGVIPTGNTTFNPYTGRYTRQVKQRHNEGGLLQYNQGGEMYQMPKYRNGGVTHTMSDGTVHPGATHEDYMDMMNKYKHGGKYIKPMYSNGGAYQPTNINQLSAIVANSLQQRMPNPQDAMNLVRNLSNNQAMANEGMKMPAGTKRQKTVEELVSGKSSFKNSYKNGGIF